MLLSLPEQDSIKLFKFSILKSQESPQKSPPLLVPFFSSHRLICSYIIIYDNYIPPSHSPSFPLSPSSSTMKKLYRKGAVHPSPPLKPDHLSFLPATILTLAVALSPEDREVLAYLISCSSSSDFSGNRRKNTTSSSNNDNNSSSISSSVDHPCSFNCYCFRCYKSYWVRWDSSPNRQLIHEIIDAYEDMLSMQTKKEKSNRKERRKSKGSNVVGSGDQLKRSEPTSPINQEFTESSENSVEEGIVSARGGGEVDGGGEQGEEEEMGKGSLRRFVSFLGEKIWGVWT